MFRTSGAGIVGTNTDVDMCSFTVAAEDTCRIAINGDPVASNLAVALELRNSAGSLIGSANPPGSHNAEITKALTPGTYFLDVKSNGTYDWIGQYSVQIETLPALPGDYNVWRAHFGQPAGSGSGAIANAAVPEPTTPVLLMIAAAGGCLRRARNAWRGSKLIGA